MDFYAVSSYGSYPVHGTALNYRAMLARSYGLFIHLSGGPGSYLPDRGLHGIGFCLTLR